MQSFRNIPQHNTSTSTAINNSTILEDVDYKMPLLSGLRDIASIQEKVLHLQDKVEHPTLYLTQLDVEAGKTLFCNMYGDLERGERELAEMDLEGKLTEISNEIIEFRNMQESMRSKYRVIKKKLIEYGYVSPPTPSHLPKISTNASFITNNPPHTNLPVISPSPIPVLSPEQEQVLTPMVATPELFRKLSKHTSMGVQHIKAVMSDSSEVEEYCGNEPVTDLQMSLAGPIRADRQMPQAMSERPLCLREFKFPPTPTQSYSDLDQLTTESIASKSNSNLITSRISINDVITEEKYNALSSFILNNLTLLELNSTLSRLRELANIYDRDSGNYQLSEQLILSELESKSKWSLIKLALLQMNLIQPVGEGGGVFIIH